MGMIPMQVGQATVLVETAGMSGSELTSRGANAAEHLHDLWPRAQQAIVEIASSTAAMIRDTARRAAAPTAVEVEFGLKFSAKGSIILSEASGEASLKVKLVYGQVTPGPEPEQQE
ncbi:CU044_2847 family protein [Nonomuraea typhae]|uniref:CU044_2847 family protein n=1 Tax=Nonomuraea typhae TaxID=2603600 RepID=A0ABW7YQ67_9ACTN